MTATFEANPTTHSEPMQFIGSDGRLVNTAPKPAADQDDLIAGYRAMARARSFDEKAIALQRTGRLGTYASCLGQEAVGVGVAQTMKEEDVFLPSFREQSAQLCRGVTMQELLLYWGGDERGSDFALARSDFPVCVPVASQLLHAVGVALAFKLRKDPRVAVAIAGDGATSKGDFYEALNMAGVWHAPVVFVISNNQWAISARRSDQSAALTLAQKAIAAGIPGEQVDGNDLIAIRYAAHRAIARAREGGGASLLECITYRLGDHTTADDASRYREAGEVGPHWKEEPIKRLRTYLVEQNAWSKSDETELIEACRQQVEDAAEAYLAMPPQPITSMFDDMFADLPAELRRQRQEAILKGQAHGG